MAGNLRLTFVERTVDRAEWRVVFGGGIVRSVDQKAFDVDFGQPQSTHEEGHQVHLDRFLAVFVEGDYARRPPTQRPRGPIVGDVPSHVVRLVAHFQPFHFDTQRDEAWNVFGDKNSNDEIYNIDASSRKANEPTISLRKKCNFCANWSDLIFFRASIAQVEFNEAWFAKFCFF